MLDNLEHNRRVRNGRDGPLTTVRPSTGLGNTNPVATLGSTLGSGAPMVVYGNVGVGKTSVVRQMLEGMADPVFVVQASGGADLYVRSAEGVLIIETKAVDQGKPLKAAGQVVLFKKVMEDWGFDEKEAATLLGFESGSDVKDIYLGLKRVGHRDANDRLRAVLRIAADLDALYQDVASIRDWLNEPQKDLGGKTPRALLNEGSMENLFRVKYYVSYLSGR